MWNSTYFPQRLVNNDLESVILVGVDGLGYDWTQTHPDFIQLFADFENDTKVNIIMLV